MKNVLGLHALHFYQEPAIIIMFILCGAPMLDNGSCMSRVEALVLSC